MWIDACYEYWLRHLSNRLFCKLQIVVSANAIGLKHKQLNNWISQKMMRFEQLTQVKQKWLSVESERTNGWIKYVWFVQCICSSIRLQTTNRSIKTYSENRNDDFEHSAFDSSLRFRCTPLHVNQWPRWEWWVRWQCIDAKEFINLLFANASVREFSIIKWNRWSPGSGPGQLTTHKNENWFHFIVFASVRLIAFRFAIDTLFRTRHTIRTRMGWMKSFQIYL